MQVGGMALRDGVLLQSERHWAAAVRLPDGSVRVRSGRKALLPGHVRLGRIPVARGVGRLLESVAALPPARRQLGVAVLPQEDPRLLAATAGSVAAAFVLRRSRRGSPLARELAIGVVSLLPALLAIRDSELSRFHGAEHKSVAAYEHGAAARDEAREHERCGSNLVAPLLLTNVAGGLLLRALGRERRPLATFTMGLVSLGTAVELLSWMARHRDHPVAKLILAPGVSMQRLFTTAEPSAAQLDVAETAMRELLRVEGVEPAGA